MISDRELEEILKKYDFKWIRSDGVFGFYSDETSYHFCIIGRYTYKNMFTCLKIQVFDEIKFKNDKIVGCTDKSNLCENIEEFEKCLQSGKLLQENANNKTSVLTNLYKILTLPRTKEINNLNKDFKK